MVGGYFPTPYPDECYYSILCRYFIRSGSTSKIRTIIELFRNVQRLSTSVFFPIRLDCVDNWIPQNAGITRRTIAINHTMYPYMIMTYPTNFRKEMEYVIAGEKSKIDVNFIGTRKSSHFWSKYLRYCPKCSYEDISLYGEPYWHRTHQLQGMVYCSKHLVRLIDSRIPTHKISTNFHAASDEIILDSIIDNVQDEYICHKEKFLKIAKESEWLLNYGMTVDWDFDFHAKYKGMLREKGIVTIQGLSDYDLIIKRFNNFWGEDFIKSLYSTMSDTREWIRQMRASRIRTFKPIYHILLMCFLKGSVKEFLESQTSINPFGEGLWLCENPICVNYHLNVCKNTEIRYASGIATGFFQCNDCGMLYKQIKNKGKAGNIIIVDYGHVWKSELLYCLGVKNMTISKAAETMKCKQYIINSQKKKLSLLDNKEYIKHPLRYDAETGAEAFYKTQVLGLCEQYDEVTISMLQEYAPGAYDYISRHDSSWLREHIIYKRYIKCERKRDEDLLKKVQDAVTYIKTVGDNKKRITRPYIARVAGVKKSNLRNALKRPQTNAFLNAVVESWDD